MVGVCQDDLGAKLAQLIRCHALDRGLGRHGTERWGADDAVGRVQQPGASASVLGLYLETYGSHAPPTRIITARVIITTTMILSFRGRDAESIFLRTRSRTPAPEVQRAAYRKLLMRGETTEMPNDKMAPVHPGEILLEEFLKPLGITQYRLAKDIRVPPRRINEIVHGRRTITADTALRLARYFGTSERFWLNLCANYELEIERDKLGRRLHDEVRVLAVNRPSAGRVTSSAASGAT